MMFITQKELDRRIQEAVLKDRQKMEEETYIRKRFAELERDIDYARNHMSDMVCRLEIRLNEHVEGGKHENHTDRIP